VQIAILLQEIAAKRQFDLAMTRRERQDTRADCVHESLPREARTHLGIPIGIARLKLAASGAGFRTHGANLKAAGQSSIADIEQRD
jgi:hypothetical protein